MSINSCGSKPAVGDAVIFRTLSTPLPRDVAPEVIEMGGVFLYDIDALQSIAEQSLALRRLQIAAADGIIAEQVADFCACYAGASLQLASAA